MKHKLLYFFSLYCFALLLLPVSANQLQNHPSPYLALHGSDPVDWLEWGEPALDKARKENKLLFVSVGYFACHWCHVMQQESFANKDIAKILNKNYISVKVDRELNPVLDKRLIEFVTITNGTAGWPLNVFLTPEGYPLVGATYLPRSRFSTVLTQLDKKWREETDKLSKEAKDMSMTMSSMLEKQERIVKNAGGLETLGEKFIDAAMEYADTLEGGFGQQQKFPQIPQLWTLLKLNQKYKNPEVDEFLHLTLGKMASKGLHDNLAGGFYRYTTDPDWETPHFEKMIYTNALMTMLYFDAADYYSRPEYRAIALDTLKFLLNEMQAPNGGYIASLSAVDDKNIEGGYYLWQQQELEKVLNKQELKLANSLWNLNRPNEFTAGNLPIQTMTMKQLAKNSKMSLKDTNSAIEKIKLKLTAHRNKTRVIPRDDKLLSGMNGLVLAAISQGIAHNKALITEGEKLSTFLSRLWDGKTLRRSTADDKPGNLFDYAAVSWGLLKWNEVHSDSQAKKVGVDIAAAAWQQFHKDGFWVESSDSLLPKHIKQTHLTDSALPSAEALLLEASLMSKRNSLITKSKQVKSVISRSLETDLFAYASLFSVSENFMQ